MAIQDIIKELEELEKSSGGGGRTDTKKRKAEQEAKRLLTLADKIYKTDTASLKKKNDLLTQARSQFKIGEKHYKAIDKQIKSNEELTKSNENLVGTIRKVGNSFVGLGKAAFEGEGSISAFTDNLGSTIGFLGRRLDTNIETFRQLSQVGGNFGKSIVDLRLAAGEAALPLDDFAKLVASNSQNLAAMFGSTTQGAKEIATLGRITREVGIDRLAPLGFTVDEINETLLLNLDSQRRTGILDSLTRGQQRDSAINFAEQLDRLAKLTGQQRDELRKQIEQQQSNERFQIALQNVTDETRQRLQGFSATVGNIAPGLNEGFQDLIANAGRPVTESALQLVQNIPEAQGIIQSLIAGTISTEEALGKIRNASIKSMDRFGKATVTGQVEFLRLQGDVINLGRRIVDVDGVYQDQNATATSLVQNLTTFEQATKVLSSQFQGIETGLLKAFGPALGGLVGTLQGAFGVGGSIATALAKAPAMTAGLFVAGMAGKFLFNKAAQIGIIAAGVRIGSRGFGGSGAKGGIGKAFGKGGTGVGGRFGNFARSGVGKGVGIGGLALTGLSAGANLADGDDTNNASAYGGIAGTAIGGLLGLLAGPGGALLGASLGGMAGQALGGIFGGKKAFGGPTSAGQINLVGEGGPELISSNTQSTVTANQDLAKLFNTQALENKMTTMVTELTNANKTLATTLSSVNTLVAVEGRALKAVEKTARKDMNQVGLV
jgi:DNA-binding transcriptional MerR regulator